MIGYAIYYTVNGLGTYATYQNILIYWTTFFYNLFISLF